MHNVAKDPQYQAVRRRLEEQLLAELKRTGDPRLIDNGKFFETPPMAGPLPDDVHKPDRTRRRSRE